MFDKLKNHDKWILFSASIYTLIFIAFYPSFYTTLDENNFVRLAYLLKKGSITILDPLYKWGFVFNGQRYVPLHPIGQSFLLLPFTLITWRTVFLSGLFLHLMGFFIFYKILKRLEFRTYNALLFLFFPYFVYYSTTLFSDFSSSIFILAAFYFYISEDHKKHILSGFLFGWACWIRYTNLFVFLAFASISFFKDRQRLKYLVLGFIPFAIINLSFNHIYYGSIFATGQSIWSKYTPGGIPLASLFSLKNYWVNSFIIFRLLLVYPLLLFAPLFYKKEGREEILLTGLMFFLFFGARRQSGALASNFYKLLIGPSTFTRYFLPIIPLFLITYIPFYEKLLDKIRLPQKPTFILAIVVLLIGSIFIFGVQHEHLTKQYSVSKEIYSNTNENSLIIGDVTIQKYLMEPIGDRRYYPLENENITLYFDKNTYIVRNEIERFNDTTENVMRKHSSQLELIYSKDYEKASYGLIKPSKLEIYRVKI